MTRPICVHCHRPYGRRDERSETVRWPIGEEMPPYLGNEKVTKQTEPRQAQAYRYPEQGQSDMRAIPDGEAYMHATRWLWDGETYYGGYKPFCTLRCALDYARLAYAERRRA
jgi:hypothetical protein